MSKATTQEVRDGAAAWFVRSQTADFTAKDWRALYAWLAADPAHADAYDEVEALWVDLEDLAEEPRGVVAPIIRRPQPKASSRVWLAAGAALAACLAVAAMVGVRTSPAPTPAVATPPARVYASLAGEQKPVVLADGTRIMLNGDTRLAVSLEGPARHVSMDKGEAIFDVAHDPARPFLIALGDRQVRVIGTQFDIVRLPSKLAVTVKRGVVAVEPTKGSGESHRLTAGQRLVHRPGQTGSVVHRVDADQALAWKSGRLIYTGAPLSDVGEDLGRYLGKPVEVDAEIASMPFTGVLNMDEEGRVLRRLETFLPIHADASADGIRLSRASGR